MRGTERGGKEEDGGEGDKQISGMGGMFAPCALNKARGGFIAGRFFERDAADCLLGYFKQSRICLS